ncbi:28 kDa ribonucleoprotein, chloroplastic-like isoform X2 [Tasmannia lanceolata]|uniref:28 kDa ribonucleoprotein, chloroplastic-like isoform X2 n=1 Tax=Tasmannia lanceolata TaxID=3420 RepID=UPI004063B310
MALAGASLFPTFLFSLKPYPSVKLHISFSTPPLSLHFPFSPRPVSSVSSKDLRFQLFSTVEEITVEENQQENQDENKRKLYVVNLPWDFTAPDINNLFGECGTVKDVEIIKQKNGKSRGFAFITMASEEDARAAIEKFSSFELKGRTIRVEFAKSMKKPSPPPPPSAMVVETRHKIYVSNLAWKVRSNNLREFIAASFNPVSCRVVFENPTGRSAGYGFASFATKEEAEATVSALDGKELMGRPVRLKISHKNIDESGSELKEAGSNEGQEET